MRVANAEQRITVVAVRVNGQWHRFPILPGDTPEIRVECSDGSAAHMLTGACIRFGNRRSRAYVGISGQITGEMAKRFDHPFRPIVPNGHNGRGGGNGQT